MLSSGLYAPVFALIGADFKLPPASFATGRGPLTNPPTDEATPPKPPIALPIAAFLHSVIFVAHPF